MLQQRLHDGLANPATAVAWCNTDLIDPQLRRFVGMYVVHARSKADDFALIDGNRQMVPVIAQELRHEGGLEVVVEHLRRDVVENRDICSGEDTHVEQREPRSQADAPRTLV